MRIGIITFYVVGIIVSVWLLVIALEAMHHTNNMTWNIINVASTGIFNTFIIFVQLIAQVQNNKFQRHLFFETLLVVFIYIMMIGFHALGNWTQNLAAVYIFIVAFILITNILKINKKINK